MQKNPKLNASGYPDPTAYNALKSVGKEEIARERLVQEYIHIVKALAHGLGLEVKDRIVLHDKETGKEYR